MDTFRLRVFRYSYTYTYAYKVRNFKRTLGLKDPVVSSSLQCPDSVVRVSCVFRMCPVFVQSGFECVWAGGVDDCWRQCFPIVDDSDGEDISAHSGDGPRFRQHPLVSAGVACRCRCEEPLRLEINPLSQLLVDSDHVAAPTAMMRRQVENPEPFLVRLISDGGDQLRGPPLHLFYAPLVLPLMGPQMELAYSR